MQHHSPSEVIHLDSDNSLCHSLGTDLLGVVLSTAVSISPHNKQHAVEAEARARACVCVF